MASETVHGEAIDGGGVRLEGEGDGEWIEADYREGWVGRKLMNPREPDAYDAMVEPYFLKCAWCREWGSAIRWGAGSALCPGCEMTRDHVIGAWFKATEDGNLPTPTECCPKCKGPDIEIGVIAEHDAVCHDCDHGWNNRETAQEGLSDGDSS